MSTPITVTYINEGSPGDIPFMDDEILQYQASSISIAFSANIILDSVITPGTRPSSGVIYPRGLAD